MVNLMLKKKHKLNHSFLKSISRNIFYKNGSSMSSDDALSIKLEDINGHKHHYFILDNECIKIEGNKNSFSAMHDVIQGKKLEFILNSKTIKAKKGSIIFPLNSKKTSGYYINDELSFSTVTDGIYLLVNA